MKLRLNNLALVPPPPTDGFLNAAGHEVTRLGHWWYYEDQTDAWIFGGSYADLVNHVREHLITNKLPVPADLDGVVQELICSMTPENWKKGCVEAGPTQNHGNRVTWAQMKRWFKTMIAFRKDRELVPQEEAERRAQICLPCVMHVPKAECRTGGCGGSVGGFLTQLAIHRSTLVDEQLGACGVCGCHIGALVHFPNETLDKASAGLDYPSSTTPSKDGEPVPCWRLAGK